MLGRPDPLFFTKGRLRQTKGEGGEEYDNFSNMSWDITNNYGDYLRNNILV